MKNVLWLIFLSILPITSANAAEDKAPIVLELFTSQSCSSCPPADKVLNDLSKQENIIALSCNVTYWNHLHWEDTLSKEFCTQRQRQYVGALNSRGPYTPQIVINGKHEMVGSRVRQIEKTIQKEQHAVKNIDLSLNNDQLIIQLPETPGNDSYALTLLTYSDDHTQEIPSGENRGRTVHYTNPITNMKSIGTWDGTGKTMDINIENFKDVSGYVVLAQKNSVVGKIIAAGQLNIDM